MKTLARVAVLGTIGVATMLPARANPGHASLLTWSTRAANEMAGTARVTSTAHYQAFITFACNGFECAGDFKRPGAHRQIDVTRLSCAVSADSGTQVISTSFALLNFTGDTLLGTNLPVDFGTVDDGSSAIVFSFNQAIDVQVGARQHLHVLWTLKHGNGGSGVCLATGTLDTVE